MSTRGSLFSLLDYLPLRDHNAVSLSHDFKFLTATVIFTEHGIIAMPLEANPTVSLFLMVSNNTVNVKHKTERSDIKCSSNNQQ